MLPRKDNELPIRIGEGAPTAGIIGLAASRLVPQDIRQRV